jgi:hypothetical protein
MFEKADRRPAMPTFLISPLAKIAISMLGAGTVIHWAVKEVRRINEELDRVRTTPTVDPNQRRTFPTLRHDPQTGDWRVI